MGSWIPHSLLLHLSLSACVSACLLGLLLFYVIVVITSLGLLVFVVSVGEGGNMFNMQCLATFELSAGRAPTERQQSVRKMKKVKIKQQQKRAEECLH